MTALRLLASTDPLSPPPVVRGAGPVVSAADHALLTYLRRLARRAQLAAPITVDHVCALIEPARPDAYGLALMRTLDAVATRPLVFHPATSVEASFDEMWLLRLLRSLESGDHASAKLLIGCRINRFGRRPVAFLAQGLAARLPMSTLDGTTLEAF